MDFKYNKTIIWSLFFMSFLFVSFSKKEKQSKKEKLKIEISLDKASYYCERDSILNLSIALINEDKWPYFIYRYIIASTYLYDPEQFLVIIKHDNKEYHFISSVIDKRPIHGKYMIYKKHIFSINYKINLIKLIEKNNSNLLFKQVNKNPVKMYDTINNENFGKYEIQVKYFNSKIDTVYSNILYFTYRLQYPPPE
ncbi:MAG: hypothetical protein B6D61_14280 [Bacteroidetes bacterium 4484_249]|nr:MAG: hypothetical protein B6D61_14280 [Bacteroidetes bacterium 4484_249]